MPGVYVQWDFSGFKGTGVKKVSDNALELYARTHGSAAPLTTLWARGLPQLAKEVSATIHDFRDFNGNIDKGVRVLVIFDGNISGDGAIAFNL